MLLKKDCLEKFIKKIEDRPHCSFDRERMHATIGMNDSTWMHVSIAADLNESPNYSIHISGGPGGYGDRVNVNEKKLCSECHELLEEMLKELADAGC